MILPRRIWKPIIIDGVTTKYEVSSDGKVRTNKGRLITSNMRDTGYVFTRLTINRKTKWYAVHRLVASSFIPNNSDLPCVNHKDEIKHNNCFWNLEWCTWQYNNTYGNRLNKCAKKMQGNKYSAKSIICFNNYKVYDSIKDCADELLCDSSKLCGVCRGRYKKTKNLNGQYIYAMYYDEFLKILKSMEA